MVTSNKIITKFKPRIRILTKTTNPKKHKKVTKSIASSTRTAKAKTPNGKAFNIEKSLSCLTKFSKDAHKTDTDLTKVAVGCSANHHNLNDAFIQEYTNCLQTYRKK